MSSVSLGQTLNQPAASFKERMLSPARVLLLKLMKQMIGREEELFASLEIHIKQIETQQRRLDALVRQVSPDDTSERLIACEERLQQLESTMVHGHR
ncbi:hypothetical protein BH10PLA2_BH10PLA2_12730 [soil metagenome]